MDINPLSQTTYGYLALSIFIIAYLFVIAEEFTELRKSKPVVVAAGIIWICVALAAQRVQMSQTVLIDINHHLGEYGQLLLFLLTAMTYINVLAERNVFNALCACLVNCKLSYRVLFWLSGLLTFFISAVADNLTTALLMSAVILAAAPEHKRFITLSCINLVVAANAGGAFSPFGDITTLMVWQKGIVSFTQFFNLFVPSLINWLVPAACLHFALPLGMPESHQHHATMKYGAKVVIVLFITTLTLTVWLHHAFHLPPVLGMVTGLGLLKLYGYVIRRHELQQAITDSENIPFDIFRNLQQIEWDTLLFFYGVVMCVGGLAAFGYLQLLSNALYISLNTTFANILVGMISALIDNIPVMYALLTMHPEMSLHQWLLVTLTVGVGGSLLSIGSAAGVALMGQARNIYTFMTHLKWTPAIFLGYLTSIAVHHLMNM